jgi:hypothetical protein
MLAAIAQGKRSSLVQSHPIRSGNYRSRITAAALLTATLTFSGCWNGDVSNIRLADISLGQQLIDLKRALEEEAISEEEYEAAREKLISLYAICESDKQE